MSKLTVRIGQFSDPGNKPANQDFHGAMVPEPPLLDTKGVAIAIADGISSSEHGRVASESCVTGFLEDYLCTPETWSVKKSVEQVLTALNTWLYSQGRHEQNRHRGHVTTLSALILKSTTAHFIHVGDSRIHHVREGRSSSSRTRAGTGSPNSIPACRSTMASRRWNVAISSS
ncbi:MAG: protein kinase [Gammaproteobacteria bacterium]|nr:protein kinase [Gammaproteobacteria bacterium]